MFFIFVVITRADEVFEELSCFVVKLAEKLIVEPPAEKFFEIEG